MFSIYIILSLVTIFSSFTETLGSEAAGNVIFISGGQGAFTSTEVLDPTGSCSRLTSPLPQLRVGHSMSRMGADVVVCGGGSPPTSCISTRSPGGPWLHHSTLNIDRDGHASVATGETIHVFGGYDHAAHAIAETLGRETRRWKKHQTPTYIGQGACAVEINNTVYLIGGADAMTQTWKWNIDQLQWTRLADMDPPGRKGHGCSVITTPGKSFLLVAGGYDVSNDLRTSAIYDIEENNWRSTGDLNQVRYGGVMVNLDDDVYMLGGNDGSIGINTVEKFNVATNQWVTTNLTMKKRRVWFGAVSVDRADFC